MAVVFPYTDCVGRYEACMGYDKEVWKCSSVLSHGEVLVGKSQLIRKGSFR